MAVVPSPRSRMTWADDPSDNRIPPPIWRCIARDQPVYQYLTGSPQPNWCSWSSPNWRSSKQTMVNITRAPPGYKARSQTGCLPDREDPPRATPAPGADRRCRHQLVRRDRFGEGRWLPPAKIRWWSQGFSPGQEHSGQKTVRDCTVESPRGTA